MGDADLFGAMLDTCLSELSKRSITPLINVISLAAGGRCAQYKSVLRVVAGLCFAD